MKLRTTSAWSRIWMILLAGVFMATAGSALAAPAKFEAQLVWATNDEKPPDAKHAPVDEETQKKLESLGLKWKHFYVVKKEAFEVSKGETKKTPMSDKCSISVKVLEEKKVEMVLYGKKGEECSRRVQTLKAGEILVHGGQVPENSTAWLVTLKRAK